MAGWQRLHGRHDLPWQRDRDPYRIWVSEVMLQQTQVATVIGYYERFLERFPSVAALAAADDDAVLAAWSGLGYYSRARHLQRAARQVAADGWPRDAAGLESLPGIGRSTAAAIATFCFGRREPILDGNVRRVYARYLGLPPGESTTSPQGARRLWAFAHAVIADRSLPDAEAPAFIQGLMDLGAQVCTRNRPRCDRCPLAAGCRTFGDARDADLLEASAAARPVARPTRRPPLPTRRFRWLLLREPGAGAGNGGDDHEPAGSGGPAGRGGVWLERRPGTGLWGGLWSPPEIRLPGDGGIDERSADVDADADADADGALIDAIATLAASAGWQLPPSNLAAACRPVDHFEHGFTHFRMQAAVHRLDLPPASTGRGQRAGAADAGSRWIYLPFDGRDRIEAAPLATPIRQLLLRQLAAVAGT